MQELAIIEDSKDFIKKIIYNVRYGRKFKKLNIDKSFSETLIARSNDLLERQIFKIIRKSRTSDDFENNIKKYLKSTERNVYASALLLGNVTGKYVFNDFYYDSLNDINIDSFSRENQDLLLDLKSYFVEYIINNNNNKNTFAERIHVEKNSIRDLSQDINQEKIVEDFEKVINGEHVDDVYFKSKIVAKYLMKTIGTYSKEDIKNNFDFILYDINKSSSHNLDDRRTKYLLHKGLSNTQLKRIDEFDVLRQRLENIKGIVAEQILLRLNKIKNSLAENISELEEIYSDYEVLYRQELIDNLYEPIENITIIDNYKDLKPQLIHRFIRNPEKFRDMEIEKIKSKIIEERIDGNKSEYLTSKEQEELNRMINQVDANLNQFKVNYTTDGKGTTYTDSLGFDLYHSDTSNQISATIFTGKEFVYSSSVGIIGIGFNSQTLTPEAIAISSNSYKTTNKGLNNLEYNEENEFMEMSAPFSELIKSNGKSEIVMHRRGIDFDTRASYIFATIDSSNPKQTDEIMEQIEQIRKKEELKVVIYDINKIRKSIEKDKQQESSKEI